MNPSVILSTNRQDPNKGILETLGDACLTPYRFLFNGRTVQIGTSTNTNPPPSVNEVASFHVNGPLNVSTTDPTLQSVQLSSHPEATGISGAFLIPGIFAGFLLKSAALITDTKAQEAYAVITNYYRAE